MTSLRAKSLDHRTFARAADWFAVGVAVTLPWSTSATGILIVLWLLAMVPTLDLAMVRRELASFAGGLPVLLWLFAAIGMTWAGVSWSERLDGLGGYHRLLAIPLLLAQFRRSERGGHVLCGFMASATCLLAASWATALIPALAINGKPPGVPVKDYVLQSGIFLICAVALIGIACDLWRARNGRMALLLIGLAALFLSNIAFVITSRTVLLVAPFLVAVLGWRQLRGKGLAAALLVGVAVAAGVWLASPHLRQRMVNSEREVRAYFTNDAVTSTALHLEFLRESLRIVETAPLFGHGTGSIAEQFRGTTVGQAGVSGVATVNPHNQVFAVAIELGIIGAMLLLSMWAAHLMLFRGLGVAAFVGEIVVIQNVISSMVNSHLFDFSQGWLYVFGVGVTGGMVLRDRNGARAGHAATSNGAIASEQAVLFRAHHDRQ